MDPSLTKALIGGGVLTALIPLVIGLLTAYTSRRANQIAERKMLIEEDAATLQEARQWRDEMRADLKREQARGDALQVQVDALRQERDTCFHDHSLRIRACDRVGSPCQIPLPLPSLLKVEPPPADPMN